ncbi:hypothetical protein GCM10023335_53820 [Streptomyces siamensis]|uniref:Uncharacterized protein n=1 Tax=Streptomyces siamensis TaxID=1274986 RepID=A0ABP9J881_9ACTN
MKGGRLRGERHCRASAERSSLQAIGEARGHCPLHDHTPHNSPDPAGIPAPRPDAPGGRPRIEAELALLRRTGRFQSIADDEELPTGCRADLTRLT